MKSVLILQGMIMLYCSQLTAQTKLWDGGGSDNSWANPLNWTDDIAPSSTDNILLDNSIVTTGYTVNLPAGGVTVSVSKLTITPGNGQTIRLAIPATNTGNPGLNVTGAGDALILNKGAVLLNSSGAPSGATGLVITNTFRINNGGRYVHNNVRPHASIVSQLSSASGTEDGTFEFDIPPGTGTISLNGRTFGNLILSATAAVSRSYTSTGSSAITVNGDFWIRSGVSFSYGASVNTITVKRNLQVDPGASFSISNGANNSLINIKGDLIIAGEVKKTGSSTGSGIELSGSSKQRMSVGGSITDNIFLKINNSTGVDLQTPVSLPYKLILQAGQLTTTASYLLILQRECSVEADSLSSSFINGPVKKMGLLSASRFLFPVGKNNMHRWLELRDVSGNFIVEYYRSNPYLVGATVSSGINHISGLEYWMVKADATPLPAASIKLSFDYTNSGGVTNLSKLLVARWKENEWVSLGMVSTTGAALSNGSILAAAAINDFNSTTEDYVTLGTDIGYGNPLPLMTMKENVPGLQADRNFLFTRLLQVTPSLIKGYTTTLTVLAVKEERLIVVVTNNEGQLVRQQSFPVVKGNNKLELDVAGWMPGIHYITGYITAGRINTLRCVKL